jgi:hypothetical protein
VSGMLPVQSVTDQPGRSGCELFGFLPEADQVGRG